MALQTWRAVRAGGGQWLRTQAWGPRSGDMLSSQGSRAPPAPRHLVCGGAEALGAEEGQAQQTRQSRPSPGHPPRASGPQPI